MNELNNFFLGVQQVAQDAVDKAPYDRTFRGVIENVNNDGTCNVRINGRTYNNVPCKSIVQVDEIVDVLFPQNNASLMRIDSASNIVNTIYPVGSIYMSINNVSPSVLFGGEWEQIKDRFLLSAGDSYNAGDVGGEATHTLTINEMPRHNHNGDNSSRFYVSRGGSSSEANGLSVGNSFNEAGSTGGVRRAANTSNTGGGQAHNNMPPYLTVYMWQRIG